MNPDPKVNTPVKPITPALKNEPERIPYPPMMSEAPASVNFYFVTKRGYNCQLTLRDTDEIRLLDRMSQIIGHLESKGCQPKPVGQQPENKQPAPKPNGNGNPAAPVTPPPTGKPAPTASAASSTPATTAWQKCHAVKMKVTPLEDGKVSVDFFAAGHQYPDVYDRMKPEQLLAMLAPTGAWTLEHLNHVASYQVSYVVEWEFSERVNSKGNPYKNILAIRPG